MNKLTIAKNELNKEENVSSKLKSTNVKDSVSTSIKHSFTVVAIGASAGGLEAITQLLQNLSPSTGMAYIVVQHLSPDHKSLLAPLLAKITTMKVQEIDDMETIEPNNVYVIPHNKEIEVVDGHIKLLPRKTKRTANLSIDILFASLAETHKENVIGIVLSGNANDGTRGLKEIKQAGGITFAQNDSAKFGSMPQSAIAQGVVDFILSPAEIAQELLWISKSPFIKPDITKQTPEDEIENNNSDLIYILDLLYKAKNVDFSLYKMNTIKRRILRRMLIYKIKTISKYADTITNQPQELETLFQDLLINVTQFFRDHDAFLALKKTIFPNLLKSKSPGETLRIWVPACATGEEVYSIAMTLIEIQLADNSNIPIQIFASDLSADAIAIARTGEYSESQVKNISDKRLQQFFVKAKDKFRISKQLRDMCVFAQHNILNDPPFSRMDFISCRNFLIYLDSGAQKKAMATFHYSLKENGCLLLGKSETIGASTQLFNIINKKSKFYVRKKNTGVTRVPSTVSRFSQVKVADVNASNTLPKKIKSATVRNFSDTFDAILLEKYVPASVVINHDLEILQFRGQTSLFLENSTGKASFNILKMAHFEINFELRNAIHQAIKSKQATKKTGIEMNREISGSIIRTISIEVIPLNVEGDEPLLMVIFIGIPEEMPVTSVNNSKNNDVAKDRRIKKLETEIAAARADMNALSRDQEAANEELQSANEEVISSNEELQSLNEELETSKEEIESTNEELITSNQELNARIQQVEELHNYYETIIATVHEPVIILDKNIRIKSANKSFCKRFQVKEEEIIGTSFYRISNCQWNIPDLREQLEDVILKNDPFHDFEVVQDFKAAGQKTLLLNAHRIFQKSQNEELIVLTIADITEVKQLAIALEVKQKDDLETQLKEKLSLLRTFEESNKHFRNLVEQAPVAMSVLRGENYVFEVVNEKQLQLLGKTKEQLLNIPTFIAIPEAVGQGFEELFENVYKKGIPFIANERPLVIIRNGKEESIFVNSVYEPLYDLDHKINGIFCITTDVTEQVLARKKIEESEQRFQAAVSAVEGVIWTNNSNGEMAGEQLGWSKLTGQNYEEYQGYGWASAIHPEDVKETIAAWNEAVAKCKNFDYEHRVKLKNGKYGHFAVKAIPLVNGDGTIREWVGVHTDISEQKNAIKKIEESEYKYLNIIYTSPYMIAIFKGRELIIEIANDAILETWGKGKDVINKSLYDVLPEAVEQGFAELMLKVYETGIPYTAYESPLTLLRNDKPQLMHYNFVYQAHRDIFGKIVGVAVVANEVTPQVQNKMKIIESEERFRLLADNLPLCVFIVEPDTDAKVSYLNKYWLDYTDQKYEEAIGKGWNDIVHPDDINQIMEVYLHAFANKIPYNIPDIRIRRHDGIYRRFTFYGNPRFLPNGEFIGMIGAGLDITEQKLFELELIQEKIKAENAVQAKQQFLNNMSHEIRTPMNAIVGFTNVIMKTNLTDSQKQYINAIKVSGDALIVLINDILDLAKVDSGKMTFEKTPFNLLESLHGIAQLFEIKLNEKNLKYNLHYDEQIPELIIGDPMRLRQIILNLFSNALKFTENGSILFEVNIKSDEKEKLNVIFKITDTGIGIREDKLDSIFNNFEQAHAESSISYGGTGLGLAIVKKLIENQGGSISVSSQLEKGTTFVFNLEFKKHLSRKLSIKKSVDDKPPIVNKSKLKNIKILVADDMVLNQLLVKIILEDFNFIVDIAENGQIVIDKLQKNKYHLILMDLHMPIMNGYEATIFIRNEIKSQIPIIALTADVTQNDIDKCKSVGMNDYVSKPINEDLLYKKIIKVLSDCEK